MPTEPSPRARRTERGPGRRRPAWRIEVRLRASAAESLRTVIGVGVAGAGSGEARVAVAAALGGVLGILKAAALGVRAAGIAVGGGGSLRSILGCAGGFIAAVVSAAGALVTAVILILVAAQRPVAVVEQQVAHQRVLAVEYPETLAAAMVPVAVLVRLAVGGDVRESGGLRYVVGFGIVLAGRLVFDSHAEVVAQGLVGGRRNLHPTLVGSGRTGFRGGVRNVRGDGTDLLLVGMPVLAHVDQQLVPGVVELPGERGDRGSL